MAFITLRADVERLKELYKEGDREFMMEILSACGFDDNFINDVSGGAWILRKEIIGKKLKKGKRGWEIE